MSDKSTKKSDTEMKKTTLTLTTKRKIIAALATAIILTSLGVWQRRILTELIVELYSRYRNINHKDIEYAAETAVNYSYLLPEGYGSRLRKVANMSKQITRTERLVRKSINHAVKDRFAKTAIDAALAGEGPGWSPTNAVYCPIGGLNSCVMRVGSRDESRIMQHVFSKHSAQAAFNIYPKNTISHRRNGDPYRQLVVKRGVPRYDKL